VDRQVASVRSRRARGDRSDRSASRQRRAARCRARGIREVDLPRLAAAGDPAVLRDSGGGEDRGGALRVPRQDPPEKGLRSRRRARRAPGGGALRSVPRAAGGRDAGLREHRRPRRRAHDGRHLGDGRKLRPDWRRLPPVGRGWDWRRARAAGSSPRDRRRRDLRRLTRRDRGGHACRARMRDRRGCRAHLLDGDPRRDGE